GERLISRLGAGPGAFDAVLLGGGTLINCEFITIARLVREQRAPLYSVGTGVGSPGFNRPDKNYCLDIWSSLLENVCSVSVRGPSSRDMLTKAGTNHVQVI